VVTVDPSLRVSGFASPSQRPGRCRLAGQRSLSGRGLKWSRDSSSDEQQVDASAALDRNHALYPPCHPSATTTSRSPFLESQCLQSTPSRRDVLKQMWRSSVTASATAVLVGSTAMVLPAAWARGLVQFPCVTPLANSYHFLRAGTTLLEEEGTHVGLHSRVRARVLSAFVLERRAILVLCSVL
jgi:hypothetical protein